MGEGGVRSFNIWLALLVWKKSKHHARYGCVLRDLRPLLLSCPVVVQVGAASAALRVAALSPCMRGLVAGERQWLGLLLLPPVWHGGSAGTAAMYDASLSVRLSYGGRQLLPPTARSSGGSNGAVPVSVTQLSAPCSSSSGGGGGGGCLAGPRAASAASSAALQDPGSGGGSDASRSSSAAWPMLSPDGSIDMCRALGTASVRQPLLAWLSLHVPEDTQLGSCTEGAGSSSTDAGAGPRCVVRVARPAAGDTLPQLSPPSPASPEPSFLDGLQQLHLAPELTDSGYDSGLLTAPLSVELGVEYREPCGTYHSGVYTLALPLCSPFCLKLSARMRPGGSTVVSVNVKYVGRRHAALMEAVLVPGDGLQVCVCAMWSAQHLNGKITHYDIG